MVKGQFSKSWEELDISDNFIFCKVMQDEQLCKEVLEILLDIKISKITYLRTENPIENFYTSRGIRLDVYVKDSNRIFDMEMQTGNYDDLILRSRYYLAASDVATTKRRTQFNTLKESYVLFICKDDPFGLGLSKYTRKTTFTETNKLAYDDKTHCVFYNCSGWEQEKNDDIRAVLKFIYGMKSESDITKRINKAVFSAKANSVFKDEYMYVEDVIEQEKEWAREEGLAEGRAQGITEGRAEGRAEGFAQSTIETAKAFLKEGLPAETIARCCKLTLEQVQKLAEEIKK